MPALTLNHANRAAVYSLLGDDVWSVTCLCAAWCDVCTDFRDRFDRLADRHPDKVILWIDIEDEAEIVGGFDVENFPTLLIQRGTDVAFYGPVEPDGGAADRLVAGLTRTLPATASGPAGALPDLRRNLAAAAARS